MAKTPMSAPKRAPSMGPDSAGMDHRVEHSYCEDRYEHGEHSEGHNAFYVFLRAIDSGILCVFASEPGESAEEDASIDEIRNNSAQGPKKMRV